MNAAAAGGDDEPWLREALAALERGELLAYPTETAWGLGAAADDADAIERLRSFKGDRGRKPFSVLVSDASALSASEFSLSADAERLIDAYWPGPLTLVLACRAPWAPQVGGSGHNVAVRCSPHPVARELAAALAARGRGPLTATSLNRSGETPARDRRGAERCCQAGACHLAAPPGADAGGAPDSTIVDCSAEHPTLLREGAIARADLRTWITLA